MAAIHYKKLLGWHIITLKLRKTVESRLPKKSTYAGEIVPHHEPRPPKSEWVISIEGKLEQGRQDNVPSLWAKLSIYRIPRYLKNGGDKDWVPQIVSLGPYHHGDEHLRHMERHKWRCLHRILERSGQDIGLYLDSVKKVEDRARAFYEGTISMSCDEFVEMMVLDGCFVIELLRGFAMGFEKLGYPCNDPVFSMRRSILEIQRDVFMLENQIPLLLDRLLSLQLDDPDQKGRVARLAIQFFNPLMSEDSGIFIKSGSKRLKFDPLDDHGGVHCLEVFWRSLLHFPKRSKTKQWFHSRPKLTFFLSKVSEAGIMIKRRYGNSFLDIRFKDGVLEIPKIVIHEGTRSLFLNLIAFEQSHFDCGNPITSYVIFMHNLINSPEDVQYLCELKIIEHCLGSDVEVVDLFNRLCQEVAFDVEGSYLYFLRIDVALYCLRIMLPFKMATAALVRKWHFWGADLKKKYFNNPWSTISVIAASILLVLTFTQTFYGVLTYHRQPRS
ncbi:hypothetical protein BT93_C1429 [Corymbia citriodora subsp. variegata]|nr:hypothetical protein BT93_C1429 [Corymbia citriodora subsp. variegata]